MPSQKLRPVQKSAPGLILCVMKISAIIYFVLEEYLLGIAYFVCEENLCHNIFCEVNLTITQLECEENQCFWCEMGDISVFYFHNIIFYFILHKVFIGMFY